MPSLLCSPSDLGMRRWPSLASGLSFSSLTRSFFRRRQSLFVCSHQSRRNSHSGTNFNGGRPVLRAVFYKVNNFNLSVQSFSSNFILAGLIQVLLSFLQNSGTSPSPFELHPTVFTVSVGCSALYYLAIVAKFMFPGFASQFGVLMSVFGSLSAATLISLTLHLPWWSIFFILLFIGGFFVLLKKLHAKYANGSHPPHRRMDATTVEC